tara:strand:- start:2963 stop:3313 length:351 start_codon:yes stop_codon:yes gene_type:complete
MAVFYKNKWVVRLGFYQVGKRSDSLAFITTAKTEEIVSNTMIPFNRREGKKMISETARVFYPKIFDEIKKHKRLDWSGVVLQKTFYQDEDGEHFVQYFNDLINDYVNLRGEVEWRK